jgi:hypothetical protein
VTHVNILITLYTAVPFLPSLSPYFGAKFTEYRVAISESSETTNR